MTTVPPAERGTMFWVGIAVVGVALLALIAFFPIATCPNCQGAGSTTWQVNEAWQRSHPVLLFRPRVSRLGLENCIRCNGRGRVSMFKAGTD